MIRWSLLIVAALLATSAYAQSPAAVLAHYEKLASASEQSFAADEGRGKTFYYAEQPYRQGKTISCTTCHGEQPTDTGRTRAFKPLKPLAPSVNPERLKELKKVEKWLRRGCKDVFKRLCTPQEKADVIRYLISVK